MGGAGSSILQSRSGSAQNNYLTRPTLSLWIPSIAIAKILYEYCFGTRSDSDCLDLSPWKTLRASHAGIDVRFNSHSIIVSAPKREIGFRRHKSERHHRRFEEDIKARSITMALFLLILSLSLLATLVQSAPIFGTENGYDAGGTEPICFTSKINIANRSTTELQPSQKASLEALNEELFAGQSSGFELLPSCFEGTNLDVELLGMGMDRMLETGSNYTFRVKLEILLSQISDKIPQLINSTIHVRFLLCDAIKQGFCNPLQDTRELDKNVVPSETDFDADEKDSFEVGANKWRYEEGKALLGITDGFIVLSRWVKWTLREVEKGSDLYKTSVDITLQLPKGIREGAYFFIGHAVMNFEVGGGVIERVDVADAIPDNILEVRNPPTIHKVSDFMKIIVGVATGIFGSFALFCFGTVIYHRAHAVMRLAQAPFLAALAGCCLVGIGFTFTFLPSRDLFCSLRGPMTFVPITTAAAIMVARTWRIYTTLSVALSLGRQGGTGKSRPELGHQLMIFLSWLAQVPFLIFRNPCKRESRRSMQSLRRAVTAKETLSLVVILSFPQVLLQVFAALYYDMELQLEFDPSANVGRKVCNESGEWAEVAGWCITAALFLLAVTVAWISRLLPSAFNEKDHVFLAATMSTVIAVVAVFLQRISDEVTTSPDIQVSKMCLHVVAVPNALPHQLLCIHGPGLPFVQLFNWFCNICACSHRMAQDSARTEWRESRSEQTFRC
jgi:hypothetical protein